MSFSTFLPGIKNKPAQLACAENLHPFLSHPIHAVFQWSFLALNWGLSGSPNQMTWHTWHFPGTFCLVTLGFFLEPKCLGMPFTFIEVTPFVLGTSFKTFLGVCVPVTVLVVHLLGGYVGAPTWIDTFP